MIKTPTRAYLTVCAALSTAPDGAASMRLAGKLGFCEVERFEAWGAEQWLGMRHPPTAMTLAGLLAGAVSGLATLALLGAAGALAYDIIRDDKGNYLVLEDNGTVYKGTLNGTTGNDVIVGTAGDRPDELIRALTRDAWAIGLDRVYVSELAAYRRGRQAGARSSASSRSRGRPRARW